MATYIPGTALPYDTLLCYCHQTASDDPYTRVGEQDMTAHVDFVSLATVGDGNGLGPTGLPIKLAL